MNHYFINTITNHVTIVYALTHNDAWYKYVEYLRKKYPQDMLFFKRSLSDIREELEHDVFVTTEVESI